MSEKRIVVIGAGMGGLVAATTLAGRGYDVTVLERAKHVGGKIRRVGVGDEQIDSGPTVLTMIELFEQIFEDAGTTLADYVSLHPLQTLARHYWTEGQTLDLFLDKDKSADAISQFSSPAEGKRYLDFCEQTAKIFNTLDASFIRAQRPNPLSLVYRNGLSRAFDLRHISPFQTLWSSLQSQFKDSRLRQLFGRYATYCGSSPYQSPATLALIAHVEQKGVWYVDGGISALATALKKIATLQGVKFYFGKNVTDIAVKSGNIKSVTCNANEQFACDAIVYNGDTAALNEGKLGFQTKKAVPSYSKNMRSLSAITWSVATDRVSFPLSSHNVFFSTDYRQEFEHIFMQNHPPLDPTVYIHAPDRVALKPQSESSKERLLVLINAPPNGDSIEYSNQLISSYTQNTLARLEKCGLKIQLNKSNHVVTTPAQFEQMFPQTGGALYGRATHGWKASFQRPGARSRLPGLYLAGGSVHPGPGVPMAAISGLLAAERLIRDSGLTVKSRPAVTLGGT